MAVAMSLKDRYIGSMVLSGVGDALGYKNGEWEFCHSGELIHREVQAKGGVGKLHAKCKPRMPLMNTTLALGLKRFVLIQAFNRVSPKVR